MTEDVRDIIETIVPIQKSGNCRRCGAFCNFYFLRKYSTKDKYIGIYNPYRVKSKLPLEVVVGDFGTKDKGEVYMIHKGLRYIIYFVVFGLFIVCMCWIIFHLENVAYLVTGEYPALGKYYISFTKEEEEVLSNVYYKQLIYNEEIDLSNLILYVKDSVEYCIENKKDIYDDDKIRIILLENGLAELENVDIAVEDEIKAQENAIKNQNGVWKINNSDNITFHSMFNVIFRFLDGYLGKVLIWFIFATGIGSVVLLIIKKL